ncbi:MAG: FAD-dependent oxidoreductase [Acidimicrobiales bacterium]
MTAPKKPTVVVAGLGDTGALIATRLARKFNVIGISTRPALVSGQELGTRLIDLPRWRRTYLIPYRRFHKLDSVDVVHGRITAINFDSSMVTVDLASGSTREMNYDYLVIATGVSNGFWRHDRVEDLARIETELSAINKELSDASSIAVIGGGATGVSVADNLARAGNSAVHLFHSGEEPLPGYHPSVRRWMARQLVTDGVTVHSNHRAAISADFAGDQLTHGPITWSTGQEPFTADVTLWALGSVTPHTKFLPSSILDDEGFVNVDKNLRVVNHSNVFAVGDVAASDPLRSSARNWGFRVVVANVKELARGRTSKLATYKASEYRWGSILGLQEDGLTVVQPNGKRFRIPRKLAKPLLFGVFVQRVLYGGLRKN